MLCEICHKNEAEKVIRRIGDDGAETELFVCRACAEAERNSARKTRKDGEGAIDASMFKQGEEPPPFVKNLLDATIGFVEGIAKEGMKRAEKCPSCGRTLKEVLDEELLGCPDCWTTFSKELEATFLKGQYGTTHVGDAPAQMQGGRPAESRASLKRALAAAIRKEEYEKAAEIQKKLDALDAAEGGEAAQ